MRTQFAILILAAFAAGASAQVKTAISLTGFNQDLVAETGRSESTPLAQVVAGTTVTTDDIYDFFQNGFTPASTSGSMAVTGLPSSGTILSAAHSSTTFQMASYAGNNALLLNGGTTGTLTLATPGSYSGLSFLTSGFNSSISTTYTLNFADGSHTSGTYTVSDNFGGSNYAIYGLGRISRTDANMQAYSMDPRLYDDVIAVSAADSAKTLLSVTFADNSTTSRNRLGVFGISGTINPVPEPGTWAALGLGTITVLRRRKRA